MRLPWFRRVEYEVAQVEQPVQQAVYRGGNGVVQQSHAQGSVGQITSMKTAIAQRDTLLLAAYDRIRKLQTDLGKWKAAVAERDSLLINAYTEIAELKRAAADAAQAAAAPVPEVPVTPTSQGAPAAASPDEPPAAPKPQA
ncbi:MAG: hypothetical protein Q7R48_02495 [bacterium]|nr:hypothetical protein [bacterium]